MQREETRAYGIAVVLGLTGMALLILALLVGDATIHRWL